MFTSPVSTRADNSAAEEKSQVATALQIRAEGNPARLPARARALRRPLHLSRGRMAHAPEDGAEDDPVRHRGRAAEPAAPVRA